MSVQAGIWNFNGAPVKHEVLLKISDLTAEFGTDGQDIYHAGSIGMLYRAFHTTPESYLERQPYTFANGKVITWDGRLDNRDDLARELAVEMTAGTTDLAIVAAGYERFGCECFRRMLGDWALVAWDPHSEEILLARDYIGAKPLFYSWQHRCITWCSELHALTLLGDKFRLCEEYVAGYLALHPAAHLTPYEGVYAVPPGQYVRVTAKNISINSYWKFDPSRRTFHKNDAEYEEHFRALFRQAVYRRLRTNSAILADLSGGLDSSSIVCTADQILADDPSLAPSLETFTAIDCDEPGEEDSRYSALVESQRRKSGHRCLLEGQGDSFAFDYKQLDAVPGFSPRQEFRAAKHKAIRFCGYRVNLSGVGGDELLGQAIDFHVAAADRLKALHLREFCRDIFEWSLLTRQPLLHTLGRTLMESLPGFTRTQLTETARIEPWISRAFASRHQLSARQLGVLNLDKSLSPGMRDSIQAFDSLTSLLTHMYPSPVERRFPFLDRPLFEFLVSIPRDQIVRPGQRRSLLRRALSGILPNEILLRKTKTGQSQCYIATINKHSRQIQEITRDPITSALGFFIRSAFYQALCELKSGRSPVFMSRLLRSLSLEIWLREFWRAGVIDVGPGSRRSIGDLRKEQRGQSLAKASD
jgi:asparagine synthase (glutamine-hydrolysing)